MGSTLTAIRPRSKVNTSARTRSQVQALVLDQYRRRRQSALETLLPEAVWADMRQRLLGLLRLEDEQVADGNIEPEVIGRKAGEEDEAEAGA